MITITKKHFTIIALLACIIALSTWAIIEYKTKREINDLINKNLAQRFDENIGDAFPLLENYALAMKDRSQRRRSPCYPCARRGRWASRRTAR